MLERVCSSAEPAAHLILRNFEKPLRSARILNPYFFRNGGECLDTPLWWPLYLESIRKVPQKVHNYPESITIASTNSPPSSNNAQKRPRKRRSEKDGAQKHPSQSTSQARLFANSSKSTQKPMNKQDADFLEARRVKNIKARTEIHEIANGEGIFIREDDKHLSQASAEFPVERFQSILQVFQPTKDQYDLAWRYFNLLNQQNRYAVDMFLYLSKSPYKRDLNRLITVFHLMPRLYQTDKFFRITVNALLKCFQHKEAIDLAFAGARVGWKLLSSIVAYFVKNLLWASVAEVWHRSETERNDFNLRSRYRTGNALSILGEDELLSECKSMIDLPTKVAALADRLKQDDPVYATQKTILKAFCCSLAGTVVESEQIMGSITGKGLLTMLDLQSHLDVKNLHARALRTILKMPEPGAKAQHALLILRNLRFRACKEKIRPSIFGSVISICGSARYPPEVYDEILNGFSQMHGKPDEAAYQRVMTFCARQGESQAVHKFFEAYMKDYGMPTSVAFVHPLIYVYASYGDTTNAKKQFDRLEAEFSLTPNIQCWNTLMLAHARSSNAFSIFKIYEEMLESGISANEYTYGTLIALCAIHGDIDSTLEWIQRTQDAKIDITVPMIGSVMQAYIYNDQIAQAEDLVEAAAKSHPPASLTRLWNSILHYYAFRSDSDSILRIQQRMKSLEVRPDGMTYAALMTALINLRRTSDAAQILRTLHFSQSLNADLFHYCLLLQGFVQEDNRAMALVIYHEIQERFPKVCIRAQKTMLKLQSKRDLDAENPGKTGEIALEFSHQHALQFLAHITSQISSAGSTFGMPNFESRRPGTRNNLLAQLFDIVLASMLRDGSYNQAEALMEQFENLSESKVLDRSVIGEASLKLLTMKMEIAINRQDWRKIDNTWNELFRNTLEKSLPTKKQRLVGTEPDVEVKEANDPPLLPIGMETFDTDLTKITPMISQRLNMLDDNVCVLPAHRFVLSRPLSVYIGALDLQHRHNEIIQLVETDLAESGFEMDGVNWNTYVQVLSKSQNPDHRIRAFQVFEKRMLPLTPRWSLLRRGKWMKDEFAIRAGSEATGSKHRNAAPMRIREKRKADPSLPIPTYFTMIYLATALMKAHRNNSRGDSRELIELGKHAKGTISVVQATPYLKDRIQGLLLRDREVVGDLERRPRSETSTQQRMDVGGIVGSKSPLDHIPPEYLEEIERVIAPRDDIRSLLKGEESRELTTTNSEDIQFAEKIAGQITLTPNALPAKGRLENANELSRRVQKDEKERLKIVEAIRKDAGRRHLVRDLYRGEPALRLFASQYDKQESSNTSVSTRNSDWLYSNESRLRTFNETRPAPTFRKPQRTARSSMDTSILTQVITPQMAQKDSLFVEKYKSNRSRREFTKNKAVRASIARVMRAKFKKRDQRTAARHAAARKREEQALQYPNQDVEQEEPMAAIVPF